MNDNGHAQKCGEVGWVLPPLSEAGRGSWLCDVGSSDSSCCGDISHQEKPLFVATGWQVIFICLVGFPNLSGLL